MPAAIPDNIKKIVLNEWLEGRSREEISSRNGISTGAVTNIMEQWRTDLAIYDIDALRDLGLSLKNLKLTPDNCALGCRVAKMMQKIGVNEDAFNYFIKEIYNRCQLLEIAPDDIGTYIQEVVQLSHHIIPSNIPEFLEAKKKEIEAIDSESRLKREKLLGLEKEISQTQNRIDDLLAKEKTTIETIEWQNSVRQELEKEGIPVDEVQLFVQCVRGIKNKNYDPWQVVMQYSDYEGFNKILDTLARSKENQERELQGLQSTLSFLQEQVDKNSLKLDNLRQLEETGFGLQELKILNYILKEIASENDLKNELVVKKFFSDLAEYEKTVGFSNLLEKNVQEINNLNRKIAITRGNLSAHQFLGPVLQNLLNKNVNEKDIIDINAILSLGGSDYFTKGNFDKQSLIEDIEKYKTIKQVLSSLEEQKKKMEKEAIKLEKDKEKLEKSISFYTSFLFGNFLD